MTIVLNSRKTKPVCVSGIGAYLESVFSSLLLTPGSRENILSEKIFLGKNHVFTKKHRFLEFSKSPSYTSKI